MIALFLGTAALPHILIRYYTVPSQRAARKSTVVAIAAIGFFYILTLFLGLGAMTNGTINLLDNNMSAPLLAQSFGTFLFAMISAIAFATVLGTVSGLIIAASGAVAHDLMDRFGGLIKTERKKVHGRQDRRLRRRRHRHPPGARVPGHQRLVPGGPRLRGRGLGQPALHHHDAVLEAHDLQRAWSPRSSWASSLSVGIIVFSPTAWELYGLVPADAPIQIKNPGIISIPLSFIAIYLVSKLTKPDQMAREARPLRRRRRQWKRRGSDQRELAPVS